MPSEVKTYVCNYCSASFDNVVVAETHEAKHVQIDNTKPIEGIWSKDTKYPHVIQVTFKDGTALEFYSKET